MGLKRVFASAQEELEYFRGQKQKMLDRGKRDRIKVTILKAKAEKAGIRVTEQEVDDFIHAFFNIFIE